MGKVLRVFLALFVFMILYNNIVAQTPMDGVYVINSAVSTGGRNFHSFEDAVNALAINGVRLPVVFNVAEKSGPYNEQVVINPVTGASRINTITFACNGVKLTFNSTNAVLQAGIKLDGAKHIIIDSLVVEPNVTSNEDWMDIDGDGIMRIEYGTGFHLLNNADSNVIRKCTVNNTFGMGTEAMNTQNVYGIVINGSDNPSGTGLSRCDYNLITQNTIIGGYYGIHISDRVGGAPEDYPVTSWNNNNMVVNNIIRDFHNVGIQLQSCNQAVIEGNDISSQQMRGWGWAVTFNEGNKNLTFRGNRIHNIKPYPGFSGTGSYSGINIVWQKDGPGTETLIANNLIYDIDYAGSFNAIEIGVGPDPNYGTSSYLNIFHNTIAIKGATDGTRGLYLTSSGSTDVKFVNNIISFSGTTGSNRRNLEIPASLKNWTLARNNYYTEITDGTLVRSGSVNYNKLATWQTVSGMDAHSVSVDPLYTDVTNGNYLPKQSVLDNRGMNVNVEKDITGLTRSTSSPDVGAYEFIVPCSAPVAPGATSVLPAIVCENTQVGIDLINNSGGEGQTYQWMSSSTENGTYANVGTAQKSPGLDITGTTSLYYKAMITCGTDVKYSTPALLIVNNVLSAGVYTINSTLPYGNRNFRSFAEALQALSCGISGPVEFNVAVGTGPYNEQVIVPAINGSSAVNTVTFNGNGEKIAFSATSNTRRGTVTLDNTKHIIFHNLQIDGTGSSNAIGVQIYNLSDSNIIRKCTITVPQRSSQNYAGVSISGSPTVSSLTSTSAVVNSNYNLIDSCTISGGYWGIVMHTSTSAGSAMTGNNFINNRIRDFVSEGIHVQGGKNIRVFGNDISRPTATAWDNTFTGIMITSVIPVEISGNKIHNLVDAQPTGTMAVTGIRFDACDATSAVPNLITNNVIYNFKSRGNQTGIYNNGSDYSMMYHNSIAFDDNFLVTRFSYGLQVASASGCQIKNNNIVLTRNVATKSYAVNVPATGVVLDYNNYYLDAANTTILTGKIGSPEYRALSAWKSGAKQDDNSWAIDPKFEDVTTGNLKPTEASLKNKGIGVGVVRDVLGARRNTTTPDVGAFEFACVNPADPAVVNNKIQVCVDGTATFNVKDPVANVDYKWYDVSFFPGFTEGTLLKTGAEYVTPPATETVNYYVEAIATNGCGSGNRVPVTVEVLEKLKQVPVVKADLVTAESVRFTWEPVPDATGYQVSRNHFDFTAPSTPFPGTSHTINGLKGGDTLSLVVKATAILECQSVVSDSAFARTLTYTYFIPNMFTPNSDGKNDEFRVYGRTIESMKLMIFNQWGQKVYEGSDKLQGWKGTFNGQPQPVGVYIYVATMTFSNGTVQTAKGTLSLIR